MVTAPSDGCLDFCVTVDVVVGGSEKNRRGGCGPGPNRTAPSAASPQRSRSRRRRSWA